MAKVSFISAYVLECSQCQSQCCSSTNEWDTYMEIQALISRLITIQASLYFDFSIYSLNTHNHYIIYVQLYIVAICINLTKHLKLCHQLQINTLKIMPCLTLFDYLHKI